MDRILGATVYKRLPLVYVDREMETRRWGLELIMDESIHPHHHMQPLQANTASKDLREITEGAIARVGIGNERHCISKAGQGRNGKRLEMC